MKKLLILISISFLFVYCGKNQNQQKSEKASIVTTTGMVGDLVKRLVGDDYQVTSLMGPGVDPHLYKASQGDINKLSTAKIVFYNGLHLEGKMTDILEKMSRTKDVVAISSKLDEADIHELAGAVGAHDPHIWFDVNLWRKTIPVIQQELAKKFPKDKEVFDKNAAATDSLLNDLHKWIIKTVQEIPKDQRIMITAHDAFGYFGKAYDIQVHGLQGISTVAEYGVNDVNNMVDLILENKIRAVFVESSVPKRSIEAVVAGVNARGGNITIGGTLYSDAMGTPGSGAEDYIGMVKHNVNTIVDALK